MNFNILLAGDGFDQIGRAAAFIGANLQNMGRAEVAKHLAPSRLLPGKPAVGKDVMRCRRGLCD